MSYRGHIENGKVVFDEPIALADGTEVRIEIAQDVEWQRAGEPRSLMDRMEGCIGIAEELPEDAAERLDEYLYQTPEK